MNDGRRGLKIRSRRAIAALVFVFAIFASAFVCFSFSDISKAMNLSAARGLVHDKMAGYVGLPYNVSRTEYGGTREEVDRLYANALDFYKLTVNEFDGVLIDSFNYESIGAEDTLCNEYGQNWVTVNHNYFMLNPIFDANGARITATALGGDEGVMNLLVPASVGASGVKAQYEAMYGAKGLTAENINIIPYDDAISKIYAYNPYVTYMPNSEIVSPVIMVWSEKYHGNETGNYFGAGYFLKIENDSPLDALQPYLRASGLEDFIIRTPSISEQYDDAIRECQRKIARSAIIAGGLAILIVTAIPAIVRLRRV